MTDHMCVSYVCDRDVWAHRLQLARSVHDMAKQMYANKRYADVAWQPLRTWLFDCDEAVAEERGDVLTKFNRDSDDFFGVVAQCLWNLANLTNVPWGRSAKQPDVFDSIAPHEKVGARRVGVRFFLSFQNDVLIYEQYLRVTLYYLPAGACHVVFIYEHVVTLSVVIYVCRLGLLHPMLGSCWGNPHP